MTPRRIVLLTWVVVLGVLAALLGPGVPAASDVPAASGGPGVRSPRSGSLVAAAAAVRWRWPTDGRTVVRPWHPPEHDHGAGHRGLDVRARLGQPAAAVEDGVVAFAGSVGGRGVVTIDHGDGLVSTLDSVQPLVAAGDVVEQGQTIGEVGVGHCPATAPCLHVGARVDGTYVDPRPYLGDPTWPVLLPDRR